MELVNDLVKKAMPSLSSDQVATLMARLEELGVLSVDDLALVDAVEIKDTLPLIQCKRFVRAIQALQAGEIFSFFSSHTPILHNTGGWKTQTVLSYFYFYLFFGWFYPIFIYFYFLGGEIEKMANLQAHTLLHCDSLFGEFHKYLKEH